jgi:hypothetical protein
MSNPLTDVREAVWNALDNDAALTAFMAGGRKYKLDEGTKIPNKIRKIDCPSLLVAPANLPIQWQSNIFQELEFTLHFTGYIYDSQVETAEEFFWLIYKALFSTYPSLGLSFVERFAISSLSFQPHFEEGRARFFEVSFDLVVTLRQNPRV